MAKFFLIAIIAWVIAGALWDGRKRNKERILAEMRETYSKREALDLVSKMKSQAMLLGLAYGFVIGVCAVAAIRQ